MSNCACMHVQLASQTIKCAAAPYRHAGIIFRCCRNPHVRGQSPEYTLPNNWATTTAHFTHILTPSQTATVDLPPLLIR